jgi:uncharacterized protein involved in exopolysaccharide biosynthesis
VSGVGESEGGRRASGEVIGLGELIASLKAYRYVILGTSLLCAMAGFGAGSLLPKKYEATVLLSPVSSQSGSNSLSASLAQFGGLAALAGISLPGGGSDQEAVATLQSDALTERYIQENNLLPVLYSKQWDARNGRWKPSAPEATPTLWKGTKYFSKKIRSVSENPKTGLVTMTIKWSGPAEASSWANGLVKLTNEYLRDKSVTEARRNIAYLNDQLAKTSVVELRSAMYSLIEQQVKKEMLARGSDEFALKVLDPARTPERPSSPGVALWVMVGLIAGFVLGLVLAIAAGAMRPNAKWDG